MYVHINKPSKTRSSLNAPSIFSFSKFLKNKAKEAVKFVAKYEDTIIDYAKRSQCKGIITGHIHKPESYTKNNIHYVNCGDFVESNTYVIETLEGDIELRHYETYNDRSVY